MSEKLPREIRICAALRCDITFRVLVSNPKKYCSRSCASRTTAKRVLREVRICANPSCDTTFEVRVTSGRKFCCGKCQCNRSQPPNWNVGLTKETDERVRRNAESIKATWTSEKRKEWGRRFSGENNGMFGKKRPDVSEYNRQHKVEEMKREKNPNWQGGIGNLPYPFEFNEEFKELIRERYNHICVTCKRGQEQLRRRLNVHHIDYDKDNLDPDNFVPLCDSCHCATFSKENKVYWTKVFQNIVEMNRSMLCVL